MHIFWTKAARAGFVMVACVGCFLGGEAQAVVSPTVSASAVATAGAPNGMGRAVSAAPTDAVAQLRAFVRDVQSGRGSFTQTVTSPDGKKTRKSQGTLEFQRPNRFRFVYTTPTEQTIVGDGKKVWLFDADLNQVTVRPMSQALGTTPAALLSGASLEKDFVLSNVSGGGAPAVSAASSSGAASAAPTALQSTKQATNTVAVPLAASSTTSAVATALNWVEARPRNKDGQFQSVRVGFRQGQLAELEILDSFGQRSRLTFTQFEPRAKLAAERFQFTPPKGADVLDQP